MRLNWWPPDLLVRRHGAVIVDLKGAEAETLIPRIEAAIKEYRYANYGDYRMWPGPNSNTFVATVLRAVPELGGDAAAERDRARLSGRALCGPDRQRHRSRGESLGLLGVKVGWVEGIEFNVLGLVAGLDLRHPALKLPGFGRIGFDSVATAAPAK